MIDFLLYFLLAIVAIAVGGLIAGYVLFLLLRNTFHSPKLYFRNIQIVPTKGDLDGDYFKWGGLTFTGELCNDSEHWAYNVMIKSVSAELLLKSPVVILNKIPLRLVSELPRSGSGLPGSAQVFNIKPGGQITTSIKIITRKDVSIHDFKHLVQELRMVQLKLRLGYDNIAGGTVFTYFWLDLQHARFIHFFHRGLGINFPWANPDERLPGRRIANSRLLELESEIS
jgi:hypothetical protein